MDSATSEVCTKTAEIESATSEAGAKTAEMYSATSEVGTKTAEMDSAGKDVGKVENMAMVAIAAKYAWPKDGGAKDA